jgi:hypothetical protein
LTVPDCRSAEYGLTIERVAGEYRLSISAENAGLLHIELQYQVLIAIIINIM